jgi:hypothetical protein
VRTSSWTNPRKDTILLNNHTIIDLVQHTPDVIFQVELSRRLNLLRAAIAAIIHGLRVIGLVNEVEDRQRPMEIIGDGVSPIGDLSIGLIRHTLQKEGKWHPNRRGFQLRF